MVELVEFLAARLDEDEQVARAADSKLGYLVGAVDYWFPEAERDEQHAVRHAPGRVLAEVDAKRRSVALHHAELVEAKSPDGDDRAVLWCWECDGEAFPCRTLRLLALPYADHPDYDEAWRP